MTLRKAFDETIEAGCKPFHNRKKRLHKMHTELLVRLSELKVDEQSEFESLVDKGDNFDAYFAAQDGQTLIERKVDAVAAIQQAVQREIVKRERYGSVIRDVEKRIERLESIARSYRKPNGDVEGRRLNFIADVAQIERILAGMMDMLTLYRCPTDVMEPAIAELMDDIRKDHADILKTKLSVVAA